MGFVIFGQSDVDAADDHLVTATYLAAVERALTYGCNRIDRRVCMGIRSLRGCYLPPPVCCRLPCRVGSYVYSVRIEEAPTGRNWHQHRNIFIFGVGQHEVRTWLVARGMVGSDVQATGQFPLMV